MSGRPPVVLETDDLLEECIPYYAKADIAVPGRDRSDTQESLLPPTCPDVVRESVARLFIHEGPDPKYAPEIADAILRFRESGLSVAVLTPQGHILNENMQKLIDEAVVMGRPGTSLTFQHFSNGKPESADVALPNGMQRRYPAPQPQIRYSATVITVWFLTE